METAHAHSSEVPSPGSEGRGGSSKPPWLWTERVLKWFAFAVFLGVVALVTLLAIVPTFQQFVVAQKVRSLEILEDLDRVEGALLEHPPVESPAVPDEPREIVLASPPSDLEVFEPAREVDEEPNAFVMEEGQFLDEFDALPDDHHPLFDWGVGYAPGRSLVSNWRRLAALYFEGNWEGFMIGGGWWPFDDHFERAEDLVARFERIEHIFVVRLHGYGVERGFDEAEGDTTVSGDILLIEVPGGANVIGELPFEVRTDVADHEPEVDIDADDDAAEGAYDADEGLNKFLFEVIEEEFAGVQISA